MVIIKIYDNTKIWDADNRNVKPIQDGLIREKEFYFGNQYTILIPYHEYGKFLMRNNYAIRHSIYLRIKEMYDVELSDFRLADLKVDDDNYIVIMPVINMEISQIHNSTNFIISCLYNEITEYYSDSDLQFKLIMEASK